MRSLLILSLIVTVTPAWGQEGASLGEDVALLEIVPLGLDQATVSNLENLFRVAVAGLPRVRLQGADKMAQRLGAAQDPQVVACGGEADCLARAGKALGVQKVISGAVGRLGEDFSINVKMVDVASGRVDRRITDVLQGSPDLLIEAMRRCAVRLVRPSEYTGQLEVRAEVSGAQVEVDGRAVGTTPLKAPVGGLTPGKHTLKMEAPGHTPFSQEVEVHFWQRTVVRVDLGQSLIADLSFQRQGPEQAPGPVVVPVAPVQPSRGLRIGAWSTLAAGLAAGAVGLGFGVSARLKETSFQSEGDRDRDGYIDVGYTGALDLEEEAQTHATVATVLLSVAGAALVTSLVLFLWPTPSADGSAPLAWGKEGLVWSMGL